MRYTIQPDLVCNRLVERVILYLLIQFPLGSLSLFQFVVSTSVCIVSHPNSPLPNPPDYNTHHTLRVTGLKRSVQKHPHINSSMLPGKMACLQRLPPPVPRGRFHLASCDFELLSVDKIAIGRTFVAAPWHGEPTLAPDYFLHTHFINKVS